MPNKTKPISWRQTQKITVSRIISILLSPIVSPSLSYSVNSAVKSEEIDNHQASVPFSLANMNPKNPGASQITTYSHETERPGKTSVLTHNLIPFPSKRLPDWERQSLTRLRIRWSFKHCSEQISDHHTISIWNLILGVRSSLRGWNIWSVRYRRCFNSNTKLTRV